MLCTHTRGTGGCSNAAAASTSRHPALTTRTTSHTSSVATCTALTTFSTRTITNAATEQNAMCIMVSVTGNGNPKLVKMYLLYRMTPAESEIQSPTYE